MRPRAALVLLAALSVTIPACSPGREGLSYIVLDTPAGGGGLRLVVRRNESALLFYAALPGSHEIPEGVFDIDRLYNRLQPRLVDQDRAGKDTSWRMYHGSVTFDFEDGSWEEFYISDEVFVRQTLKIACGNTMESTLYSAGDIIDRACEQLNSRSP